MRHEPNRSTALPIVGARTGARPLTSISREKSRAVAMPEVTSRTMARERTTPAAAVKPWMNRSTARIAIEGATAQSREAQTYAARPTSSGARRPRASLRGPISSWPSPRPTSAQVSVSWTADALAPNVSRSCGNAGRYMSNESGPRAAIAPRITTRRAPGRTIGDPQGGSLRHRALYACCGRPSTNGGKPLRIDSTSAMRSRKRQRPSGQRTSVSR